MQVDAYGFTAECFLQVQQPDHQQAKKTKWCKGKTFVVYFDDKKQVEAVVSDRIQRWGPKAVPRWAGAAYRSALRQAVEAVNGGAPV